MNRGSADAARVLTAHTAVGHIVPGPVSGGPVGANNQSLSLYQRCQSLLDHFDYYQCFPADFLVQEFSAGTDPVTILWTQLRQGSCLCHVLNSIKPGAVQLVNYTTDIPNLCKKNVYYFLAACRREFAIDEKQLFSISALYNDDTNDFVKVIDSVESVLDIIEDKYSFSLEKRRANSQTGTSRTSTSSSRESTSLSGSDKRDKVVHELLETERKYVQDLELLQNYKQTLKDQNIITQEGIKQLFNNLDSLVDFQRRLLIGIEREAGMPSDQQRIGQLFCSLESHFSIYEAQCVNQSNAADYAMAEANQLAKCTLIEPNYELPSILIKPTQRICKYPLLMTELVKNTSTIHSDYNDLQQAVNVMKAVADRVNENKRKEDNKLIMQDLEKRVEDWKGCVMAEFGDLLIDDLFPMFTDGSEKEMHLFLFQKMLICCREQSSNLLKMKKGKPTLQLKGRIFVQAITAVENMLKSGQPQTILKILWRDGDLQHSFQLKFRNEQPMQQWQSIIERLIEDNRSTLPSKQRISGPSTGGMNTRTGSMTSVSSRDNRKSFMDAVGVTELPNYEDRSRTRLNPAGEALANRLNAIGQNGRVSPSGPAPAPNVARQRHASENALVMGSNARMPPGPAPPSSYRPASGPAGPQLTSSGSLGNLSGRPPLRPTVSNEADPVGGQRERSWSDNTVPSMRPVPQGPLPPPPGPGFQKSFSNPAAPGSPGSQRKAISVGSTGPSPSASTNLLNELKVKVHYETNTYLLRHPRSGGTVADLREKIARKCNHPADRIRLRFKDSEGDMINVDEEDDWENACEAGDSVVLYVFVE